jgi:ribA/ribD-fused uncharacterized protein
MSTKDEIFKQNVAFVYKREESHKKYDPDKRSFIKTKTFIDPDAISSFTNTFECLDPSYLCNVCIPGQEESPYPSFEHALQAIKFPNSNTIRSLIRQCETVKDAKNIVSKNNDSINVNWKDTIVANAEKLLRDKFIRNKSLRSVLLSTKRKEIIFANDYGDQFWGVSKPEGKGQNNLGKLLQKIRSEVDRGDDLPLWMSSTVSLYDDIKLSINIIVEKDGVSVNEDSKVFTCRNKLMIGKDEEMCDVIAAHPSVSRVHLIFLVDQKRGPMIIDLNSANGTTIDGKIVLAFVPTPITSNITTVRLGASSRVYKFIVDMNYHLIKKEELYSKIADPNFQKGKESDKKEFTVFVSNLPFHSLEADVYNFFSSCGNITSLTVPVNKEGECKGIAFVTMENMTSFIQALSRDGELLLGRPVKVKKLENSDNKDGKKRDSQQQNPSHYQRQHNSNDRKRNDEDANVSRKRDRSRSHSIDSRDRRSRRSRSRERGRRSVSRERRRPSTERSRNRSRSSSFEDRNRKRDRESSSSSDR